MTSRTWKRTGFGIPAIGVSALPKVICPVCSPAYTALVSSLGVGFLASTRYLLPLTAILLALALASLFTGMSRRGRRPFWIGTAAATFILVGKFAFESAAVMYAGVGLLVIASVWNAIPRRTDFCVGCLSTEARSQQTGR